jgi:hypothetical protein
MILILLLILRATAVVTEDHEHDQDHEQENGSYLSVNHIVAAPTPGGKSGRGCSR